MYPRLQTVVKVDLVRNSVVLHVKGAFTTTNCRALVPMIRRAYALPGNPAVTVDITSAQRVDSAAGVLLTAACNTFSPGFGADTIPIRLIGAGEIGDTGQLVPRTASAYSLAS